MEILIIRFFLRDSLALSESTKEEMKIKQNQKSCFWVSDPLLNQSSHTDQHTKKLNTIQLQYARNAHTHTTQHTHIYIQNHTIIYNTYIHTHTHKHAYTKYYILLFFF